MPTLKEESDVVERLREKAAYIYDLDSGSGDAQTIFEAATLIEQQRKRIEELESMLIEAIEGWEDGSNYKGDYLKAKHGDAEGIARARALLGEKT